MTNPPINQSINQSNPPLHDTNVTILTRKVAQNVDARERDQEIEIERDGAVENADLLKLPLLGNGASPQQGGLPCASL